ARRLACRVTCRPHGCLASTRTTLGAPPTPSGGCVKRQSKTRAQKRAAGTRRCCLVLTLSPRHSGRAAIAARAGIHNHRLWVWIPGSRASPAPRNDAPRERERLFTLGAVLGDGFAGASPSAIACARVLHLCQARRVWRPQHLCALAPCRNL